MKKKVVLAIAGSDSGAGAGIQADIKTMAACGVYGTTAVTALTAQNTMGVQSVYEVPPEFLAQQLDSVLVDLPPDAVKIGMVSSAQLIEVIAGKLAQYQVKNIVLDPILVSTSGTSLLREDAENALMERLFPAADVITPNVPECQRLTGRVIQTQSDMQRAAEELSERYGCAVICKGGHLGQSADDLLAAEGKVYWIRGERIVCENNHGTGCTYSSAIASGLALGMTLPECAGYAKEYMNGALRAGLALGHGNGPLEHFWRTNMNQEDIKDE